MFKRSPLVSLSHPLSVQNSPASSVGRYYYADSPSALTNQACATVMERHPWVEVLLFHVLHITSLYPTRQPAYRVATLPAAIYLARRIYQTPEAADPLQLGHTVGCAIAYNFMFRVYLLFSEGSFPDHWRRVRDEVNAGGGVDQLPSNFSLTKKVWWAIDIAHSSRMIGWVQEPRGCMPPHPPPSRRTFLRKTFFKFIKNIITSGLTTSALTLIHTAFDNRVHDPTHGPEAYLTAAPLLHRIPYILIWSIRAEASLCAIHNVIALVLVGLGNSSPTLWPDMWGSWGDAYTVRRLWEYVRW